MVWRQPLMMLLGKHYTKPHQAHEPVHTSSVDSHAFQTECITDLAASPDDMGCMDLVNAPHERVILRIDPVGPIIERGTVRS